MPYPLVVHDAVASMDINSCETIFFEDNRFCVKSDQINAENQGVAFICDEYSHGRVCYLDQHPFVFYLGFVSTPEQAFEDGRSGVKFKIELVEKLEINKAQNDLLHELKMSIRGGWIFSLTINHYEVKEADLLCVLKKYKLITQELVKKIQLKSPFQENVQIRNTTLRLISKHFGEKSFFDFKCEWHKSKADLILDILCMSNCVDENDKYLIIGVRDNGDICGVDTTSANIRNDREMQDFIFSLRFAFSAPPKVEVIPIIINENAVYVIRINDGRNRKPFFLEADLKDGEKVVRSGVIYNRTGSRNSPITKGANPVDIEGLWRERFV